MHSIRLPARWDDKFAKLKIPPYGMFASPLSPHMFGLKTFDHDWTFFVHSSFFSLFCIRIKSIIARCDMKEIFPLFLSHSRVQRFCDDIECSRGTLFASTCVELSYILCTIVGGWWKMIFFSLRLHILVLRFFFHDTPTIATCQMHLMEWNCSKWPERFSWWIFFFSPFQLIQSEWDSDKLKNIFYIPFSLTDSTFVITQRLNINTQQRCHFA